MIRVTADNLGRAIAANVRQNARLVTDELPLYKLVTEDAAMRHETVQHQKDEYVRGDIQTNTVEGFFSLLKRGVNGIYHHVSREHLARYCDEFAFRYENRKSTDSERVQDAGGQSRRQTADLQTASANQRVGSRHSGMSIVRSSGNSGDLSWWPL